MTATRATLHARTWVQLICLGELGIGGLPSSERPGLPNLGMKRGNILSSNTRLNTAHCDPAACLNATKHFYLKQSEQPLSSSPPPPCLPCLSRLRYFSRPVRLSIRSIMYRLTPYAAPNATAEPMSRPPPKISAFAELSMVLLDIVPPDAAPDGASQVLWVSWLNGLTPRPYRNTN